MKHFCWCMMPWLLCLALAGGSSEDGAADDKPSGQPSLLAQAPVPAPRLPGSSPALGRRTTRVEGLTPEISNFLSNLVATYRKADSYSDRGRVKLVQQSGRVKTTTEMPMELAFERPNRLLLDAGQYTVASDGKALLFVVPELKQYTAGQAPENLEKKHLQAGSVMGGADEGHPELIDFLIEPRAYETLMAQVTRIGWKPDGVVEGTPCRVLAYETLQGTSVVNFIDPKRMVLLKVEAETPDTTRDSNPVPGAVTPPQPPTSLVYELAPVELNPKIESAAFAYKPPAGFRRVREIGSGDEQLQGPRDARPDPAPASEGAHLTGLPAPEVRGKDLSGQTLAPADLRGKVVLLFFWSLSGGEYCLTSIPIVQQVADHFAARPDVLVLGISGDAERADIVAQLLERKKATFRTLIDEGMKMQLAFQLGGVPTFVVIGPNGTVTWAKLGAPPSLKSELISQIEKLLPPAK